MQKLEWHTEQRTVSDLVPHDFNPRTITKERQGKLINSLEEFGLVETPVINLDNKIIAGERRWEIYIQTGKQNEQLDVRVPNRMLTPDEVKKYMLISNTHAGQWDLTKIEAHFSTIDTSGILDLPTISLPSLHTEVATRASMPKEPIQDDYDEQELEKYQPVTKYGDLYELNHHRILCADAEELTSLTRLMNGKKADIVFTDPPYNVKVKDIVGLGKVKHEEFKMASGEMNKARFTKFLENIFFNLIKSTKSGSIHYVCMDWKHIHEIIQAGQLYAKFMNMCVWVKDNGGMGSFYRSKHELIFVFKNGKAKHTNNFELGQTGRYRTNVWDYVGVNSFSNKQRQEQLTDHPTVKPVLLVADALLDCSSPKEIVIDTFLGSGTTLIAAEQTDRICYAAEMAETYCDTGIRRYIRFMKQYGQPLTLKRNGETINPDIFFIQ